MKMMGKVTEENINAHENASEEQISVHETDGEEEMIKVMVKRKYKYP